MRTMDMFRMLAWPLAIVTAVLLASRRNLIRNFEDASALSADRAIAVRPRPPFGRWWLRRLTQSGVLVATPAGAHWLRQEAWRAYRGVRRRRAPTVVAVLLVALGVALWWGR